jgi:hypothetical protein
MELSEFVGAILRRWYIALLGLMLTGGLAYGAMAVAPPNYHGRGLVVLLPSQAAVGPGGNPFLALDGLDLPARVVVAYFASSSTQADIAKAAPGADVTVAMEESTRGPVIAIDATAPTPAQVLGALKFVAGAIPTALSHLQDEVAAPKSSQIRSEPLTMDKRPTQVHKATIRLVILAVGLGLAATGFLTFSIDGLVRRRAALRSATSTDIGRPGIKAAQPDKPNRRRPEEDPPAREIAGIAEIGGPRAARVEKVVRKRG